MVAKNVFNKEQSNGESMGSTLVAYGCTRRTRKRQDTRALKAQCWFRRTGGVESTSRWVGASRKPQSAYSSFFTFYILSRIYTSLTMMICAHLPRRIRDGLRSISSTNFPQPISITLLHFPLNILSIFQKSIKYPPKLNSPTIFFSRISLVLSQLQKKKTSWLKINSNICKIHSWKKIFTF